MQAVVAIEKNRAPTSGSDDSGCLTSPRSTTPTPTSSAAPFQLYLSSFVSASGSCLSLTHAVNSSVTTFGLSNNDCINDVFDGVAVRWEHVVTQRQSQNFSWRPLLPDEKRSFQALDQEARQGPHP
ncbi:hypothetical protein NL676_034651 [Syzygium grande]|nr:hypothetical protein NL676_034651 [Syzygium grande]